MRNEQLRKSEPLAFRAAKESEKEAVSKVLSLALAEDPLLCYLTSRAPDVRQAMEVYCKFCFETTDIKSVDENLKSAALWVTPGFKVSLLKQATMIPEIIRKLGWGSVPICFKAMVAVDRMHPKEPHYYLMLTGVLPEMRNQGLGSLLLRPVLDRCDREKVGAYLETSNPRNIPFYERLGFKKTRYCKIAIDAPQMWAMWRDPVAVA